ncbi:AI-2E family transporter [Labilibacter marinus]|uniref:AI-2E family transporter n=1 Tax=Labilibacter marinus TaxID=1477105 RepID=UPI00094F5CB5|nr:AI-2E family transporter [Labilibacter marinus]
MQNKTIIISPILKLAGIIIIIAGLKVANSILLPLLLALFVSIICAQPILWLIKKKIPNWLSILIVLSGLLIILIVLASIIGNSLSQFTSKLPKYEEGLNNILISLSHRFNFIESGISFDQIIEQIDTSKVLQFSSNLLGQLGNLMSNSFVILLVTIFILAEMNVANVKTKLLEQEFSQSLDYLNEVGRKIRHYLSLKTLISLITGILITIWLLIFKVEYAILWGVIAFLLNYIPNIGSIIAAVPTMLLALVDIGFSGFLWTGVGYLLVNVLMGSIIEPKLMGRGLGLSTLVVFISLIFWGYIFGGVGMFLSIPITISFKIILEKNENTKWISLLLSSGEEVDKMLKANTKN